MEDERDAEYAIRRLDRTEFGRKGRRLRVEWTKVIYDAWARAHTCISYMHDFFLIKFLFKVDI